MTTTAIALLVLFLAALSIRTLKEIGYVGANPNSTNQITVDGTGDALATPDIATFSFSVTETAKTVVDAQTAATTKINATLKAVRDGGVADKDISTESYTINPHYDYQSSPACVITNYGTSASYCPPSSKSVLTGYDVSETIQVKVRDLTKAGALFAAIGALNVDNLNGLNFSVDNPDAIQAEARSKAIADAQSKAQELAKELGVSLGAITNFSDNSGGRVYYAAAMSVDAGSSGKATAPAPEIPAGEQKVTDNVSITYEIK